MRKAMVLALAAHCFLLLLLPGMPEFKIPTFSRNAALNVFIRREAEPEVFEQELEQVSSSVEPVQMLQEAQSDSSSVDPNEDGLVSDEAPELESRDVLAPNIDDAGQSPKSEVRSNILISRAAIQRFTDYEATLYSDQNKDELERFRRSFASSRSYRRRNQTRGYQNSYGDVYVRNSSSSGDVCFVQKQNALADEAVTRTVYFYRCDSEPKFFELNPKG